MAQSKKLIKLRIKSVRNTRKITKAMELVAASKMRRAVASALRTRSYADSAFEAIRSAAEQAPENVQSVLLHGNPKAKRSLVVLFSSDRGLAGGLNVNLARAAIEKIRGLGAGEVDVIGVGKKGADAVERAGIKVIARFPALSNNPVYTDLLPTARLALDEFMKGTYKTVTIGYTHFVSGISQRPTLKDFLPFAFEAKSGKAGSGSAGNLRFEPSPHEVFERMLPAVARTMLYQSLLESVASEHAARMLAMRNASDSALEMLDSLTFTYNQARQAGITQEIAEISSGKAALE
ncbi:MAG: ATP synthase F1 subunit gamma [Patescibacteria group bacterium]|jgi:F-type H+-transporting ATPase subunit gamma